jgi:hypothetical protein
MVAIRRDGPEPDQIRNMFRVIAMDGLLLPVNA